MQIELTLYAQSLEEVQLIGNALSAMGLVGIVNRDEAAAEAVQAMEATGVEEDETIAADVISRVAEVLHTPAPAPAPAKRGRKSSKEKARERVAAQAQAEAPAVVTQAEALPEPEKQPELPPAAEIATGPIVTFEQVKDAVTNLSRKKGLPAARTLVNETFSAARVADIKPEQYAAVLAKVKELIG